MNFVNRQQAGQALARALTRHKAAGKQGRVVVLALPRGGVVIGAEVARHLNAPLDLVLVRKIGHPQSPEYAIGAVAEGAKPVYNRREIQAVDRGWLKAAEAAAKRLIERRRELYYGADFDRPKLKGKTVLLVDDGIATGLTVQAAVQSVRAQGASKIVVAVPVAPADSLETLRRTGVETVILTDPNTFSGSVGNHYQQFDQVSDDEVRRLLKRQEH